MNWFDMDYTEKFILYLDGELPAEQECELFSVMNGNDSVLMEFRNIYSFVNKIKNNNRYYAPAPAVTESIFSELAINPNITEPVREKTLFEKKKDNLLSGVIGSLITVALLVPLFILLVKNSENHSFKNLQTNYALNPISLSNQNIIDVLTKSSRNQFIIPVVKSETTEQNKSDSNYPIVINEKHEQEKISHINEIPVVTYSDLSFKLSNDFQKESMILTHQISIENKGLFQEFKGGFTSNVRYEFRYNIFTNFVQSNPNIENSAILKNITIGAIYQVNPALNVGLELNQEEFSIKEKLSNSSVQTISKNFTSYELVSRFYFKPIYNLDPYIQLNLGVNKKGCVTRAELGTRINIDDNFGLITGIKLNGLIYTKGSELNLSSKAAFSCGFSYNL